MAASQRIFDFLAGNERTVQQIKFPGALEALSASLPLATGQGDDVHLGHVNAVLVSLRDGLLNQVTEADRSATTFLLPSEY